MIDISSVNPFPVALLLRCVFTRLLLFSGLKKLLKEGEKLPAIYADPTFAASSNWILSTSQLTSEFFEGWGYGEGETDQSAVCYIDALISDGPLVILLVASR